MNSKHDNEVSSTQSDRSTACTPSANQAPTLGTLFTREWPAALEVRGHVVIVHGYAEHCERHASLATTLSAAGFHVHACDLRGHGRSPGRRGFIADFSELLRDVDQLVTKVRLTAAGKPVFLFGHSMGGLLAVHHLAAAKPQLSGAIISSPLLAIPARVSPWLLRAARVLSTLAPWLPVDRLDSAALSRDVGVVNAYDRDPLVYHGPIRARTGAELAAAIQAAGTRLATISLPLLILHGTADRLAPWAGGRRLYDEAGSADKECLFVEGGFHELLNDWERDATLDRIVDWLHRHTPGR